MAPRQAHDERLTGVAWHPEACLSLSNDAVNIGVASADCNASLWSLSGEIRQLSTKLVMTWLAIHHFPFFSLSLLPFSFIPHACLLLPNLLPPGTKLQTLKGHTQRLARCCFHPLGAHFVRSTPTPLANIINSC